MRAFLVAVLFTTLLSLCQVVCAFAPPGAPAQIHDRLQALRMAKSLSSSAAVHAAEAVGTMARRSNGLASHHSARHDAVSVRGLASSSSASTLSGAEWARRAMRAHEVAHKRAETRRLADRSVGPSKRFAVKRSSSFPAGAMGAVAAASGYGQI